MNKILTSPSNHSLIEIFNELKYGRPIGNQEFLDMCIEKLKGKKIPNTHKLPLKLWKTLETYESKKLFNDLYKTTLKNQTVYTHPKMNKLPKEQWKTICWNMALEAAWLSLGINTHKQ